MIGREWTLKDLGPVLGKTLIDVEVFEDNGPCDCGQEVVLHFTGGAEIAIYVHPETGLTVESD